MITDEECDVGGSERHCDFGQCIVVDVNQTEAGARSHEQTKYWSDDSFKK